MTQLRETCRGWQRAAEFFDCSVQAVKRIVRRHHIPYAVLNGKPQFFIKDLEVWLRRTQEKVTVDGGTDSHTEKWLRNFRGHKGGRKKKGEGKK
jgi:hypothetical protein